MDIMDINDRGIVLVGCGKMGSALLGGWLRRGVKPASIWVSDPQPSDWVTAQGTRLNQSLPEAPAIVVVAVKPQIMTAALPVLAERGGGGTLFLSVAAGITLDQYERLLGFGTPVVRAMPNTPAAVGKGISAIIANGHVTPQQIALAEELLLAVGQVVRLGSEDQMDAVTAVSGSGPAYVFHLIEALASAGVSEGLPSELAVRLATATVAGAGALAESSQDPPGVLRQNVTSPGGTTAAALAVLMDESRGFTALLREAVHAAVKRSRELGK